MTVTEILDIEALIEVSKKVVQQIRKEIAKSRQPVTQHQLAELEWHENRVERLSRMLAVPA